MTVWMMLSIATTNDNDEQGNESIQIPVHCCILMFVKDTTQAESKTAQTGLYNPLEPLTPTGDRITG